MVWRWLKPKSLTFKIILLFLLVLLLNGVLVIGLNFYLANSISSQDYDEEINRVYTQFTSLYEQGYTSEMAMQYIAGTLAQFNKLSPYETRLIQTDEFSDWNYIEENVFRELQKKPGSTQVFSDATGRYVYALFQLPVLTVAAYDTDSLNEWKNNQQLSDEEYVRIMNERLQVLGKPLETSNIPVTQNVISLDEQLSRYLEGQEPRHSKNFLLVKRQLPMMTEQASQVLNYSLLAMLILAIPTFTLLYFVLRNVSRPLIHMSGVAERIADGEFEQVLPVKYSDERGMLAYSLVQLAEKLKQKELSRETFLAAVSHELRTPLTVIKANTRGMLDGVIEVAETPNFLNRNLNEIDRLMELVNDLILVSSLEQGLVLNREHVQVDGLIQDLVQTFRVSTERKQLKLEIRLDAEAMAWLDPTKFKQVLINVMQNAIEHCPEEGTIWIQLIRDGTGQLRIIFRDSGHGFHAEMESQLFERFVRGPKSSGLGLGLYISRIIVEAHDGEIRGYNHEHGGACVELLLKGAEVERK